MSEKPADYVDGRVILALLACATAGADNDQIRAIAALMGVHPVDAAVFCLRHADALRACRRDFQVYAEREAERLRAAAEAAGAAFALSQMG